MKTRLSLKVAASLLAAVTSASAQTLGTAANYDIFVMKGGKIELKDSNQLFGQVGYSDNVQATRNEHVQNFDGAVYVHTGASFTSGTNFNPSGGVFTSGFDGALDQANADVLSYASYLSSLTADFSQTTKLQTAYSLDTTKPLTVIDFTEIDLAGSDFTFNGRADHSDRIIIRVSNQLALDGTNVNLTNLDHKDVIWYYSNNGNFDLHKGGNSFKGTIVAPTGTVIIGETDFQGAVYGFDLKMGSGFLMEGNTVPEPSSSLMLISGIGMLLLFRRRNR